MVRRPPEILITTPESLNILLSSRAGRAMLTGIATVILDEIHAVVGTKRGTHLITAVERLVLLSGEFQRIALSATVKPLAAVAEFVGGFIQKGDARAARYEKRAVAIIRPGTRKRCEIRVTFPPDAREQLVGRLLVARSSPNPSGRSSGRTAPRSFSPTAAGPRRR